jgi:outer membrane autotransporter protein
VVQPLARQLGLTQLGTLHERIGDTLTVGNAGNDAEGWARSAWGRMIGQQIDNRYEAFADPRADGRILGMQAGLDLLRTSYQPGHRDVGGLYFSYLNGNADVDGLVTNLAATAYVLQHTGTVNLNAYSFGGYWTHYGPGDWYLDAIVQGTIYDGNTTATFGSLGLGLQSNLSTSGSGFLASLEGGYPIPIPQLGPNFILEPQAQIIWQHTDFDQANDGVGNVWQDWGGTAGSVRRAATPHRRRRARSIGRAGLDLGHHRAARGARATLYSGAGFSVPLLNHSTRLEFAGGLTYKLQPNLSAYAQAGYEFAISPNNVQRDGVKGDIGLRYTW